MIFLTGHYNNIYSPLFQMQIRENRKNKLKIFYSYRTEGKIFQQVYKNHFFFKVALEMIRYGAILSVKQKNNMWKTYKFKTGFIAK